ncbi:MULTISPECIES: YhcN/YlaJ family sporulation lipoprotein [unclassified Paenibacillus]|uniref:YhcN/YlaJ family sporulation lipoprotein n=1 Tax=unclassified Paenibacillus TaxID=185978 RepID=UPI002F425E6D
MKRQWAQLYTAAALTSLILLSCACGQTAKNQSINRVKKLSEPNTIQQLADGTPYEQRFAQPKATEDGRGRINQEQMKQVVLRMNGIQAAEVVMHNNDVLVGIQVDNNGKQKMVEKQTLSSLSWQYPTYKFYVTSDDQLRSKLAAFKVAAPGMHAQSVSQDLGALINAISQSMAAPR